MLKIGFVLTDAFQMMALAAASVFEFTNLVANEQLYSLSLLSERGGPLRNASGIAVETQQIGNEAFDTLIFGSSVGLRPTSPALLNFAQTAHPSARRVASICVAAFILAESGLLDDRRVTTHWLYARELQARFPKLRVEEDRIFIIDGKFWTSAGMSAGIDLALGMVEKDFGAELTRRIAQGLVLYHRRGGGQSQHSALLAMEAKSDRIQAALTYAKSNLQSPLTVEELAEAAHLSPRQFSRIFHAETGQTPAKAVENLRLEAARVMMEQSRHPIEIIAAETGFADRERMRRAFIRAFGQPPQAIRRQARN